MTNLTSLIKSLRDIMRNDSGINGDAQRIEQIIWLLFLKVYNAKEATWDLEADDYQSILPARTPAGRPGRMTMARARR